MGLKAGIKNIFKFIVAGVMTLVFIGGLLVLLNGLGKIGTLPENADTVKFVGIIMMAFGLIFGVIPFLSKVKWIIKFAFSLLGIVVFIFGVCGLVNWYNPGTVGLEWANMDKWVAYITTIIGVLFGVLPFFKFWGKVFGSDEKSK